MNNTKSLTKFFIVTFLWSWAWWVTLILMYKNIIPVSEQIAKNLTLPVAVLGAFGPLAGALWTIGSESGKKGIAAYLRNFLDLRLGWKAYLFPVIILGSTTCIAWLLPELFGYERLHILLPSIWIFIPYLLAMIFLGGGQEEFGWRGYALPRLESSLGVWKANFLLGTIWAVWHLPLWFIPGTSQTYMNFGGFMLLTIGYSFLFSWFRKLSGYRPIFGLYSHGMANALIPMMPVLNMQANVPQPRFWIWVSLTFAAGILITLFTNRRHPEKE